MKAIRTIGMLTCGCLMALAMVPAQASAQTPAPSPQATGTWELAEVNGTLPAVVDTTDNCTEEVTAAELVLADDGTWQLHITERETCGTEVNEDMEMEDGTYTVQGGTISFMSEDADADDDDVNEIEIDDLVSATIDGSTMQVSVRDNDAVLVFNRRE